jgi:hypothetical protein
MPKQEIAFMPKLTKCSPSCFSLLNIREVLYECFLEFEQRNS